jgi:DNA-binding MarR family transcriptional regulator
VSAAAPVSAVRPARLIAPERRITLPMRIALGFLHTGALYRGPGNIWRCRAFPQERVLDRTVRALEEMGACALREYLGHHDMRRACMALTEAGIALYAKIGGRLAHHRPPPVQAEGVLRETEIALDEMAAQEALLAKAIAKIDEETRATREAADRIEQHLATLQAHAARFDDERSRFASHRQNLGAFARQAAERLGAAIVEAGQ